MSSETTNISGHEETALKRLPVRFRRDPADLAKADPKRGIFQAKRAKDYYLEALKAVFQADVSVPGTLGMEETLSGAEVLLLNPGPCAAEVLGLASRFPEIKCLHIVESDEVNLDAIRSELTKDAVNLRLPELAGYVTDILHLPEELARRCDVVVAINVVDPKADRILRQDVAQQISRALKLGGLFYSAGETIRWTDSIIPLSLVRIPIEMETLKRAGYSDALPEPAFFLKRLPDESIPIEEAEEGTLREWWRKGLALIGQDTEDTDVIISQAPFVPRVEDGRGELNIDPWDFLITKPAVRRPAMAWTPETGDHFGKLTLGDLLQFNSQTGMYVFRVQQHPEVVLKMMKPFEGDIPDDPLQWDSLRKSKTLKRENQALRLLKGLPFIPQHIAHGYDPLSGWYAIVIEFEKSRALSHFMVWQHNQRQRRHENADDVQTSLEPMLKLLNSLAIVHDKGLVHQDLKPAHVLLRPDSNEAVLIDWGVARQIDEPLSDDRRSISWLHAAPERADLNVKTAAAIHQDLYAVGVMVIQLASDKNLNEQPRFLLDFFSQNGRMPMASELDPMLRPQWKWVAPVVAQAISSRKEIPGYADNRYTSAAEMTRGITRSQPGQA